MLLAAFSGAVSDAGPEGQVLLATNVVKLGGCGLLSYEVPPLLCHALAGLGATGYVPAKYGILPELLPPGDLVAANGWIDGTTVVSIVAGLALGGVQVETQSALPVIASIFLAFVIVTLMIPRSHAQNRAALANPRQLIWRFVDALALLWNDRQARASLAVTSLFWAAAAVLEFMVLRRAGERLGLHLSRPVLLQLAVAIGMVAGTIGAARFITVERALRALPLGLLLGAAVILKAFAPDVTVTCGLLILIGALVAMQLPLMGLLLGFGALFMAASACVIALGAESRGARCSQCGRVTLVTCRASQLLLRCARMRRRHVLRHEAKATTGLLLEKARVFLQHHSRHSGECHRRFQAPVHCAAVLQSAADCRFRWWP